MAVRPESYHYVIPNQLEEIEKEIEMTKAAIEDSHRNISGWEFRLSELNKQYTELFWMNGRDFQTFDYLEVESNWENWKQTKEKFKTNKDAGVFHIVDNDNWEYDGLRVSEAKKLIKHLQHKIDYLESEEN